MFLMYNLHCVVEGCRRCRNPRLFSKPQRFYAQIRSCARLRELLGMESEGLTPPSTPKEEKWEGEEVTQVWVEIEC